MSPMLPCGTALRGSLEGTGVGALTNISLRTSDRKLWNPSGDVRGRIEN